MASRLESIYDYFAPPTQDFSQEIIEGGKNAISVLNSGGAVTSLLGSENKLCPAIQDGNIQLRFFAAGASGAVADITFVGMGTKRYVVKATKILKEVKTATQDMDLQAIARFYYGNAGISPRIMIELNGGNPTRVYRKGDSVILPLFATECKLQRDWAVTNHANANETIAFPAGSYLCPTNAYSEYLISLLAGEIYRGGTSINFLDTFNFATCSEYPPPARVLAAFKKLAYKKDEKLESLDRIGAQYTFIEKVDGVLVDLLKSINPNYIPGLVIQLLHAIATYQEQYKIVHGDLHMGNVFYLQIKPDTMWNGKLVSQAQYFSYRIGDTVLYLPASPYILKIGDWGLSVKYSNPIVGDEYVIVNGYKEEGKGMASLPNFYSQTYDMLYSLAAFNEVNPSDFILDIIGYLIGDYKLMPAYFRKNLRPVLPRLLMEPLYSKTVRQTLKDPRLMQRFLTPPPPGATVIELGRTP